MRAAALVLAALGALGATAASAAPAEAAKQPPRTFFGIGPQAAIGSSDVARMAAGGIGTLRVPFSWAASDQHPPAGELRYSSFDPVVTETARRGITILPVLYGTPTWVAGEDGRDCYPHCQYYLPMGGPALHAWETFVPGVVARYGPGGQFWVEHPELPETPIRAWQIWNEQNSGQYTRPQPSVQAYAKLISSASRAARRVDPKAKIVLGGMFHDPVSSEVRGLPADKFLRRFYQRRGIAKRFEGIAVHPYSSRFANVRSQVSELRRVARRAGDPQVSTWITEIGWASGGIRHPLNKGVKGQAKFLRRTYRLFIDHRRRWRVRVVSWFSWRDSAGEPICKWCPESGLFDSAYGLQPKPAWDAYIHFSGGR